MSPSMLMPMLTLLFRYCNAQKRYDITLTLDGEMRMLCA